MTFYKVLNENGTSSVIGHKWPLPKNGKPGAWVKSTGPLALCENGVHLCDGERQLLDHLGPVIYEAEVRGERIDGADKIAVRKARLLRRVPQWNERTARLFAALCAEQVLPIFEAKYPNDDRPRKAIEAARLFADGLIDSAAWAAARDAARAAAGAAAGAAARAAAWAAAGDAAGAAAWAAAWAAAGDAAWAAAWAAAGAAAGDAARAAAGAAAWAAARDWQADRLRELLNAPGEWE